MGKNKIYLEIRNCEVFTHTDGRIFNITDLKKWLISTDHTVESSGMPIENVEEMLASHEWEINKRERMRACLAHMDKEKKIMPLICATPDHQGEGMWIDVIDGWHRLAILHLLFKREKQQIVKFPAYWVKWSFLAQFEVPKDATHGGLKMPPAGERKEEVKIVKL